MRCFYVSLVIIFCYFSQLNNAHAWGERGHDIVTQVAVRILVDELGIDHPLVVPLLKRSDMLGHLANVPDIVWRNQVSEVIRDNAATHYVTLEWISSDKTVSLKSLPWQVEKAIQNDQRKKNKDKHSVGSAPWRIQQLYAQLSLKFKNIAEIPADQEQNFNKAVDDALLYAGILSHFVGDLSQPEHTTMNYDGQFSEQKCLHAYFETEMVSVLPLSLAAEVFQHAKNIKAPQQEGEGSLPVRVALALAWDAHQQLKTLHELDFSYAIVSKSKHDNKQCAKRHPVDKSVPYFRELITHRLAVGARTLAYLWHASWVEAGKPDMRRYHSYVYPVAPHFISPDYQTSVVQ